MGKLWAIIKREYLERVRSKWFLISTLFGPVVMAALFVLPAIMAKRSLSSGDTSNIVIIDATGAELGRRLAASLGGPTADTTAAQVRVVPPPQIAEAESAATGLVMNGQARGYLVLDAATLKTARVRYAGRNASSLPDMERLEEGVQRALLAQRLEAAGMPSTQVNEVTRLRTRVAAERLTERGRGSSGRFSVLFAFAIAFLLYTTILLYGQAVLRGVVDEKTTRVAEVVVAGVPSDTLMVGKVLGIGAVAMTQIAAWATASVLFYRFRAPLLRTLGLPVVESGLPDLSAGTFAILLLFFVLGFVLYSSLFAAVGATVNNDQDAQQASTPLMLLVVVSAVLIQPVVIKPDSQFSAIVSWIPFSAPILMPVRLSLVSVPWYEVAAVIAGLVLSCLGALWVASRIYRIGLLMYGKRPSWGELARWVRAS